MEILCLGKIERGEFRLLWEKLPPESRHNEAEGVSDPLWILLLRDAPGGFSSADVDHWKRRYPVSPILMIQGSWCEGESWTEKPRGVHGVYWYDFLAMFPREWSACQQGLPSVWTLPELYDVDAWALADAQREKRLSGRSPQKRVRVAIFSDDWDQYALLRDFFVRDGHTVFSAENAPAAEVLVYDMPDFSEASQTRFRQLGERFPGAQRVVTLEFPRWNEWRWLEEQNAIVFPKPFRWTDLRDRVVPWT